MMRCYWRELTLVAALALLAGCGDSKTPQTPAPANAPPASAGSPVPATPPAAPPATTESAPQTSSAAGVGASASPVATAPAATASQPTAAPAPVQSGAAPAKSGTGTASGQLLKQSELKDKPFIDAKTVATLSAQSKVSILERSGGWYRVSSSGKSGWLRMLDVKVTGGAENLGGSNLGEVASLATGRSGSGNVVSTSGLRGLNEEKLSNAKPDYGQLDKLDGYGVSEQAALDYAKKNGLHGRQLAYLPAVKR